MKRRAGFLATFATVGLLAAGAQATPIIILPDAGLAAAPLALAAFNRAASTWSAILQDPITVTINANFTNMSSPNVLGSTSSAFLQGGYSTIRNQMVADAGNEPDDAIVASLPTAGQFSTLAPASFGLDGTIVGTKANLKALGFGGLDGAFGASDAAITFNSGFTFDFDNSDGVGAGLYDFETVALHEIGHVLGFLSIVDTVDFRLGTNQPGNVGLMPLDLFRFRTSDVPTTASAFTTTPRSIVPNSAASFSDTANTWAFSTGFFTGDGHQASHWRDDALTGLYLGLMDPTLSSGDTESITLADLRALDVIGWDVQTVPEPASLLLLGTGLAGLRAWRKRRA